MKKWTRRLRRPGGLMIPLIVMVSILMTRCGGGLHYASYSPSTQNALSSPITFLPASGPVGTLVTLKGIDFSTTQSVSIGGVLAIPISQTTSSLVGFVMPKATSGKVSVTTTANVALTSSASFNVTATGVPLNQQGAKLMGTGASGAATQGFSVSLSADGNTALSGGFSDNSTAGASWVFIRSGGLWTQQGTKLVGTGALGSSSNQGKSLSLSADGNTALIGGSTDNTNVGAVWVFTRSGGVWTQQGSSLIGTGGVAANQGSSVSISADGNTALIGGPTDNTNVGAAWVFTRSGGVWTQQGTKLVGTGVVGNASQGQSTSLSSDGNTALIGGTNDNAQAGAAWVFARSGGVWTQQGTKLVGTGATGTSRQGSSVSLNADGTTALIGAVTDGGGGEGATWVFTRSGGVWTQQGVKLIGTGGFAAAQGASVSLSADGTTALIGGSSDNSGVGATWVFTRSGGVWTQQGTKLVGTGSVGASQQGSSISISADGNAALIGGPGDTSGLGAAWVFTP